MKVLFVSATEYAVEHFVGPYIKSLVDEGNEVHVLTGVEIGSYSGPPGVVSKAIELNRRPSPIDDFKQLLSLRKYIRKHNFDVVYSISPKGGLIGQLAAWSAKSPCRVHFFTGQVWKTKNGIWRWLLKQLDAVINRVVTRGYVDSRSQMEFLIEQKVLTREKSTVLGEGSVSGVVVEDFLFSQANREQVRSQYGIADDEVLVFFLGRISKVKGVTDLLEAYSIARVSQPKLRLLIVGPDDGNLEAVKQKIVALNLQDSVCSQWSSTPRPAIQYSAADIFCVPSYMEGFGNVVLESACAGVPTIGSNIYGLQDSIVDGETGILFEVADVQELAKQMVRLANDKDFRQRLGRNALQRASQKFSQEYLVQEFLSAHRQLVGSIS